MGQFGLGECSGGRLAGDDDDAPSIWELFVQVEAMEKARAAKRQ